METLLLRDNLEDIQKAADIIRNGGIVAVPTETVYGLAANALDGNAVAKIFKAKNRPMDNPLIVHISDIEMIDKFSLYREFTDKAKLLAEKFWPGPLTIILPKGDCIPDEVSAGLDTVAVRFPSHKTAQELIRLSDRPLAAPSANLSGKPSPTKAEHCVNDLMGRADAIIDGGDCAVGVESTVVTLATNPPKLLRPGGVTAEELRTVLGELEIDDAVLNQLKEGETAASPGMKYKHYAPKAQVYLVRGKRFCSFVNRLADDNTAVICFEEDADYINAKKYVVGNRNDYSTHAQKIFDILREIDRNENITKVYAPCPVTSGVSLAVYNRMIRAAAFRVINADACVVGLTGPTGSGKSVVDDYFAGHGYHIVDTDKLARRIFENGSPVPDKIKNAFGSDVFMPGGTLNRRLLAKKAFKDKESTELLNSITHPYIYELSLLEIEEYSHKGYDKFILDAPVLFESGGEKYCDKVLTVTAPLNTRIQRVMNRDGITYEEANARINAQHSDEYYISRSDYNVVNDGSKEQLSEKLDKLFDWGE